MSYSILYDKQFIKVGDNLFIPMVEGGDNNVYEAAGNGRKRARDWYNNTWCTNGKYYASYEGIMSCIDKIREERIERAKKNVEDFKDDDFAYDDKRFGWHEGIAIYGKRTSNTTFGNFKGFFKKGCDEALTVEQLKEYGVGVCLRLPYWSSVDEKLKELGLERKAQVVVSTTDELLNTINEWEQYYGNVIGFYIDFDNKWAIRNIKIKAKKIKDKKWIETNTFYVLESLSGYFVKNVKYGYKYAYTGNGAKKFIDENSAKKFHNKMKNKDLFKITKLENSYGTFVSY